MSFLGGRALIARVLKIEVFPVDRTEPNLAKAKYDVDTLMEVNHDRARGLRAGQAVWVVEIDAHLAYCETELLMSWGAPSATGYNGRREVKKALRWVQCQRRLDVVLVCRAHINIWLRVCGWAETEGRVSV